MISDLELGLVLGFLLGFFVAAVVGSVLAALSDPDRQSMKAWREAQRRLDRRRPL